MLYLEAALYTACGVSAGVAAMLAACAYLRRMTTSAVVERLDRQDETLRQVVTEVARLKGAVQFSHEALAERVGAVVAEALVVARREGEMRGFARGLAAARQLGDGDTGPIP